MPREQGEEMSFAFMPVYTGDYARDTRHLTPEEHGVYLLLLMYCWDQRGPVPLDERRQCGIVNARSGGEIESLRRVLGEFFTRMEDGWYNKRMSEEVAKAETISGYRRAGALEKARRRRDAIRDANQQEKQGVDESVATTSRRRGNDACSSTAQALLKQSMSSAPAGTLTTTTTTTTTKSKAYASSAKDTLDAYTSGFLAFWGAYPNLGRRKNKAGCWTLWRAKKLEAEAAAILDHVEAMKETAEWRRNGAGEHYEPEPIRYLKGRDWEDGTPETEAVTMRLAL